MEKIENWGKSQGYICYLNEKTGLKHAYIVIGLALLSTLLLFNAVLNGFVLFIFAVLAPAYRTFKAIESPDKEDDTKMLYYWCVLGFLVLLDKFFGFVLALLWFPGLIRLGILLALTMGDYKLSKKVYEAVIEPVLRKYDVHIERATAVVRKTVEESGKEAADRARAYASEKIAQEVTKRSTGAS